MTEPLYALLHQLVPGTERDDDPGMWISDLNRSLEEVRQSKSRLDEGGGRWTHRLVRVTFHDVDAFTEAQEPR